MSSSSTPRPAPPPVPANETFAQRAARQLAALMKRHTVENASQLEKMQRSRGANPVVSQVTIRRILAASAATEPEKATLRRLAEFFHETYEAAFPEPAMDGAIKITVDGKRFRVLPEIDEPISPATVERIQRAFDHAATRK